MALTNPGVTRGIPDLDIVRDYIANSAVLWEYAGCKPHAPSVEFVARGAANAVFRFTAGKKTLALRASIAANTHSSHEAQVAREYEVLRCLENHRIAPQPVILDVDENLLGTPLIIMEYLSGPTLTYSGITLTEVGRLHAKLHSTGVEPASVRNRETPAADLLDEIRTWFAQYAESKNSEVETLRAFENAIHRCEKLPEPDTGRVFVHGDATYTNFIQTEFGLRLIDWDWCRISDPVADASHFLSPITTGRQKRRLLTQPEEDLYVDAYVSGSKHWTTTNSFKESLRLHRPIVVLHSAIWTAAWLANTPVESPTENGPLNRQNLSWQISKDFLTYLTDQGFW